METSTQAAPQTHTDYAILGSAGGAALGMRDSQLGSQTRGKIQ